MMLSIVIPTREEEKIIAQTISQFRDKLLIPHEIIVSDGKSKDRTAEIARGLADKTIVFEGSKHTAGIGRNDGAKVAIGDYIAFVDSGVEIPDPNTFFERALAHFKNNPEIVGITGPQRAAPNIETWADRFSFGFSNAAIRFKNNVLHDGEALGKFMLVPRPTFEKIGGFRNDLATCEDSDFFYRLSRIGRTVFDPSLMIYHGARRAHTLGWMRLWWIWVTNVTSFALFNKAIADDWTPVR
ncbi:MAG: glycosyltransferase [Candidatus Paceibacterota bacterium]|jgi:glycosyltransferase involved in cell wall biosynthesis